ncbi:MAG: Lrp/AsnC family transcriptional regulator [Miniphocaeibacter sp.]|uniref:Lrp/AsnC family transcriptional regulator n=1 Tax=Miniphocaeibacter sp. TaxID=3100973 RepID=UPI00182FC151|nr:Lrp/AsnC family transcriptional regulator [Gallicola sp.]
MNLDLTDIKILKLLEKNSRLPIRQISQEVNMSQPSVKQRIEKLEDNNIIKGYTINIDFKKSGFSLPFFIALKDLKIHYDVFSKSLKNFSNISKIYSLTGKYNYFLKGYCKNLDELEKILLELKKYGEAETYLILDEIKNNNLL